MQAPGRERSTVRVDSFVDFVQQGIPRAENSAQPRWEMNKYSMSEWIKDGQRSFMTERAFRNPKGEGSEVNATLPNHLGNG